jgi:hypothetical protein
MLALRDARCARGLLRGRMGDERGGVLTVMVSSAHNFFSLEVREYMGGVLYHVLRTCTSLTFRLHEY